MYKEPLYDVRLSTYQQLIESVYITDILTLDAGQEVYIIKTFDNRTCIIHGQHDTAINLLCNEQIYDYCDRYWHSKQAQRFYL